MSESEIAGSDIYLKSSVVFEQGQKYMICAQSGHGKSSLLNFIYGSSRAFDGTIDYGMSVKDPFTLRRSTLSYLFQDLCLFPQLTAMENLEIKNNLTHHKSSSELASMLSALLPSDKKDQPVRTLSLGQRQRVAVVRALCQPFRFLMLDEPFSHIDRQNSEAVAALVMREVEQQGAALIVTALDAIDLFPFDHVMHL